MREEGSKITKGRKPAQSNPGYSGAWIASRSLSCLEAKDSGADIPTPVPSVIDHGARGTENSKAFGLTLTTGEGESSEDCRVSTGSEAYRSWR